MLAGKKRRPPRCCWACRGRTHVRKLLPLCAAPLIGTTHGLLSLRIPPARAPLHTPSLRPHSAACRCCGNTLSVVWLLSIPHSQDWTCLHHGGIHRHRDTHGFARNDTHRVSACDAARTVAQARRARRRKKKRLRTQRCARRTGVKAWRAWTHFPSSERTCRAPRSAQSPRSASSLWRRLGPPQPPPAPLRAPLASVLRRLHPRRRWANASRRRRLH